MEKVQEELRIVISLLVKRLRKQMYSIESFSMTEIATVGLLYKKGPLLPSELAEHTKIKAQSMSQIIKKMEAHTVVKKIPSREDGRKVYISLTPLGMKMVEKTKYERDGWLLNAIENCLTEKEKHILISAIPVLHKIANAEDKK